MVSNTIFILYCLNTIELFILICAIIFGAFVELIALQASLFHRNLSLLCAGLYFSASVSIITQTILAIAGFQNFDILAPETFFIREGWGKYVEWVRIGGYGAIITFIGCIICERALATYMLRTYERKTNFFILAIAFLSSIFVAVFGSSTIIEKTEWILYIAGLCIVISMALGFLFFYTFEVNKRRYKETQRNPRISYTLSERFQLRENIRTMTIMRKCVFVLSVGNIFILIIFALNFTEITGIQFLIRKTVNILVAINALVFNYVAISNIPAWNRIARQIFSNFFRFARLQKIWDTQASALDHIKSFTGKPLVFSIEKEREIYFKQLNDSWN